MKNVDKYLQLDNFKIMNTIAWPYYDLNPFVIKKIFMYKYYAFLFFIGSSLFASQHEYSLRDDFDTVVVQTLPSLLKNPDTKPIEKSLLDIMCSVDETESQLLVIISLESPKSKKKATIPVICTNTRQGKFFLKETLEKSFYDARFPKKDPLTFSFIVAK